MKEISNNKYEEDWTDEEVDVDQNKIKNPIQNSLGKL
jgi:hypothetical protein